MLRICDIEEIVQEWYEINLNEKEEREFTLKNHGFLDLINHDDDFDFIQRSFSSSQYNLRLEQLLVGGIDQRVIKLFLKAQSSALTDQTHFDKS